jgi:hypothetical protein
MAANGSMDNCSVERLHHKKRKFIGKSIDARLRLIQALHVSFIWMKTIIS